MKEFAALPGGILLMCRRATVALIFLLGLCQARAAQPETASGTALVTVRADLAKGVNSGSLKQGDPFFLNTTTAWQQGSCTIRAGTLVTGEVAALVSATNGPRRSVLSVRFAPVSCSDHAPMERIPILVAMQRPPLHFRPMDTPWMKMHAGGHTRSGRRNVQQLSPAAHPLCWVHTSAA
jgi:hypothetical protein